MPEHISITRNKESLKTAVEKDESLKDFYNDSDKYNVTKGEINKYEHYLKSLTDQEKTWIKPGLKYYELTFSNKGGLVMPLILSFEFEDNSVKEIIVPVEIWRRNNEEVSKVFQFDKVVKSITLDPHLETADTDLSNNLWPPKPEVTRFQLYKWSRSSRPNSMQQ